MQFICYSFTLLLAKLLLLVLLLLQLPLLLPATSSALLVLYFPIQVVRQTNQTAGKSNKRPNGKASESFPVHRPQPPLAPAKDHHHFSRPHSLAGNRCTKSKRYVALPTNKTITNVLRKKKR